MTKKDEEAEKKVETVEVPVKALEKLEAANVPKHPWLSKINWLGVLTVAIGIMEYLKVNIDVIRDHSYNGIMTVIIGVLLIIFRTLTSRPIAGVTQFLDSKNLDKKEK